MKSKCFFCEDNTSSVAHIGCFVKASERQLLSQLDIAKFNLFISKGGHMYSITNSDGRVTNSVRLNYRKVRQLK